MDRGAPFTVSGYDQTKLNYIGTWGLKDVTAAWGGSVATVRQLGAAATLSFTGSNLALVGPVGPSFGAAKVYVDGTLTATISEQAATGSSRQVLYRFGWPSSGAHTIKVVTTSACRFDIDGLVSLG